MVSLVRCSVLSTVLNRRILISPRLPYILSRFMIHQNDCCKCRDSLHTNGPHEVNNVQTVLALGDSNTWAFDPSSSGNGAATLRHPYRLRWTTQVEELLGHHVHVIPEGLNARTTTIDDPLSPCDGDNPSIDDDKELKVADSIILFSLSVLDAGFHMDHFYDTF